MELETFKARLKRIGIEIKLISNYPWVYLYKVNGKLVTEKSHSDYLFTIAFSPVVVGNKLKFIELEKTFKVIRKYLEN